MERDQVFSSLERLMRLETQQEQQGSAISDLTGIVERLTRVEERQQSLARIVYGAIGALVTIQVAGVLFVLERFTGG